MASVSPVTVVAVYDDYFISAVVWLDWWPNAKDKSRQSASLGPHYFVFIYLFICRRRRYLDRSRPRYDCMRRCIAARDLPPANDPVLLLIVAVCPRSVWRAAPGAARRGPACAIGALIAPLRRDETETETETDPEPDLQLLQQDPRYKSLLLVT